MKAMFTAADKGPLGTKTATLSLMQNYLKMTLQIRMLQAKRGIVGGGFINLNVGGSDSGGGS